MKAKSAHDAIPKGIVGAELARVPSKNNLKYSISGQNLAMHKAGKDVKVKWSRGLATVYSLVRSSGTN